MYLLKGIHPEKVFKKKNKNTTNKRKNQELRFECGQFADINHLKCIRGRETEAGSAADSRLAGFPSRLFNDLAVALMQGEGARRRIGTN